MQIRKKTGGGYKVSDKTFALLMNLPAVQKVSAVTVNGSVKHYNVQVKLQGKGAEGELVKLWPFGNVSTDGESAVADYIVRPEEVEKFCSRLLYVPLKLNESEVAIVVQFDRPLADETKHRVAKSVRASDRIIWGEKMVAIILRNCGGEAVKAVQERIRAILVEQNDISFSVRLSNAGRWC